MITLLIQSKCTGEVELMYRRKGEVEGVEKSYIGVNLGVHQSGGIHSRENTKRVTGAKVWKPRKIKSSMTLGRDIGMDALSIFTSCGLVGKFSY